MKKRISTIFQFIGLLAATYFTWALLVMVYDFMTETIPDHNIYVTALEEVKVKRMISSH